MPRTAIAPLDDLLAQHAAVLGDEVVAMIHDHHKLTPPSSDPGGLVDAFRKADWVDVSHGVLALP